MEENADKSLLESARESLTIRKSRTVQNPGRRLKTHKERMAVRRVQKLHRAATYPLPGLTERELEWRKKEIAANRKALGLE